MKLVFWIITLAVQSVATFGWSDQTRVLSQGQTFSEALKSGPIHIADPKVLSAQVVGNRMVFTGKKQGESSLRWGSLVANVYVVSPDEKKSWETLKKTLPKFRGLSLKMESAGPVVEGRLLRFSD
ncbi:MAG: pilus assembly protein N-terminal domain-containing protein, partial [Bdellovibrionales bacterium]|nr:pilus assembly protein N-terminal domain-containing protein [Bdellovibrionales bacterium]